LPFAVLQLMQEFKVYMRISCLSELKDRGSYIVV
jgi:hypothetical protein